MQNAAEFETNAPSEHNMRYHLDATFVLVNGKAYCVSNRSSEIFFFS